LGQPLHIPPAAATPRFFRAHRAEQVLQVRGDRRVLLMEGFPQLGQLVYLKGTDVAETQHARKPGTGFGVQRSLHFFSPAPDGVMRVAQRRSSLSMPV